jgi:hypothetical protein
MLAPFQTAHVSSETSIRIQTLRRILRKMRKYELNRPAYHYELAIP